jgi:hypothetical protein
VPERSIRFGISDGAGQRGATWKCFAPIGQGRDDVYVACRELKGAIKTSLHESGKCHVAYEPTFFEQDVPDADRMARGRFIDKWPRPPEIAPGLTLALRINTPWSAVNVPNSDADFPTVIWIPNAPQDQATEIDILLSTAVTVVAGWPGKNSMNTKLVGSLQLDSGAIVWVVYWVIPLPDLESSKAIKAAPKFFRGKSMSDLEGASLRMIAFGDEPDGSRVIYDFAAELNQPKLNG